MKAASIKDTLLAALDEIQIRSQVEESLQEMCNDIVLANQLEEQLLNHNVITQLQQKVTEQELALEEARAVQNQSRKIHAEMADKLVGELWSLSSLLGHLQSIKEEHEALLAKHDEVVARLVRTEEELEKAQRVAATNPGNTPIEAIPAATAQPSCSSAIDTVSSTQAIPEPPALVPTETVVPIPEAPATVPASAAVVEIDADGSADDTPRLDDLDTQILMHIFGYLDALDILNTAQVNISMYSRVDSLFGFGQVDVSEDSSTIATVETAPSTRAASSTTSSAVEPSSKSASQPVAAPGTTTPAATQSSSKPTALKPSVTPPATTNTAATASRPGSTPAFTSASPASATSAAATASSIISSLLQPRKQQQQSSAGTSLRSGGTGAHHSRSYSADGSKAPMSAAVASSMASKLSDVELNAIIVMTERLKHKENLVERLAKENEKLTAKLQGTESVKQFLIHRVREMEQSLTTSEEEDAKVAQQISSDQEVIAFLDCRVQELESETARIAQEKLEIVNELARVKEQAEQKSIVMGDMLQFEREKLKESGREWRAAKRLLIKEVKHCRAQIMALQAERGGFREQNERLRKAVLHSPGASREHLLT